MLPSDFKINGDEVRTLESWTVHDEVHVSVLGVPKTTQTPGFAGRTLSLSIRLYTQLWFLPGNLIGRKSTISKEKWVPGAKFRGDQPGTSFQGSSPSGVTQDTRNSPVMACDNPEKLIIRG